jgi:UDP-3-O-[3-hydroxymyristoyl] glucosamine N-acyltransferase
VGAGVKAGAYAGIFQDVPDGMSVLGVPAKEAGATLRSWKLIERLPAMRQELRQLKKRLDALEQSEDH